MAIIRGLAAQKLSQAGNGRLSHPIPYETIAPQARRGWRCPLTRRFEYATATVVLLVILRLAIGWHFFKEGDGLIDITDAAKVILVDLAAVATSGDIVGADGRAKGHLL